MRWIDAVYDNCVGFERRITLHQNIGRSTVAGCVGTVEALERVGLLSRKGATGLTIKISDFLGIGTGGDSGTGGRLAVL